MGPGAPGRRGRPRRSRRVRARSPVRHTSPAVNQPGEGSHRVAAKTDHTDERFERITAGVPDLPEPRIREILRDRFGLRAAALRPLAGETDRNLYVRDEDGAEFVFKLTGRADLPAVEFQSALLRHLAAHDPFLAVPRVVPGVDGEPVAIVEDGGRELVARVLTWVSGRPLAEAGRRSAELMADVGAVTGRLTAATAAFEHPDPPAPHYWEFGHMGAALAGALPYVADGELRAALERVRDAHAPVLAERFDDLPVAVVHHDLNAFNVLVTRTGQRTRVSGLIDFGDALPTARIADLAVLAASVMRGQPDPLGVARALTAAYHTACPLTEAEAEALFPLIALRAATVAGTAARLNAEQRHGDPRHRSAAAADLVRALAATSPELGVATMRQACGLAAHPAAEAVTAWLAGRAGPPAKLLEGALTAVDLSATGDAYDGADPREPAELRAAARTAIEAVPHGVPVGRYGEPRFLDPEDPGETLGVELFAAPGTPVSAPLAGRFEHVAGEPALRHEPAPDVRFWTLYGGLAPALADGEEVPAGGRIGEVAPGADDDGLPARVRLRVAAVPLTAPAPHRTGHTEAGVWRALLPDPTPLLAGCVAGRAVTAWTPVIDTALRGRKAHLPETHPTYFEQPINMVRARDCRFYDEHGRAYLDALNNVTLVGHCHPRLVAAATRQLGRLNTNSRFVYDLLSEYAERLTATLPDGLDVVYFVNSGSEANDLALRISRYLTKRDDVVIIDDAYHGYTTVVADVSPSRYRHYGKPDTTHPTPVPDRYRGAYGYDDPQAGAKYAAHVIETFDRLAAEGRAPAAYLFEALLAGGGQVVLPPGYLAPIFAAAAERGIVTIADEVQVGFGRLGEAFWGFQTQGPDVVPDMVTMGKSMGNGFPVAALVTTREISRAFDPTGRFFSTYGGNPVACAVGLELLGIMEEEDLQRNALTTGGYLLERLGGLAGRHELIGDVRGQGFYSGVEFVRDRRTKEPASEETLMICERLKDEGVLVYPTGPHWNILKLKPPLSFTPAMADEFAAALDRVLEAGW
ncbi:aminotransferase [Spongiactinospora gelatinilytica]|uniref:Aminotransferase n=1 Tax=Spongiactinospora gelatinilytica TaxID=2666298 RepID=A0A2W2GB87_9ACTN|nr:aminotransferase [Spongiactinospora gelatinilytica]